jgi:hypothetical protein
MTVEPIADHGTCERHRLITPAVQYFSGHFHVPGMNSYKPFIAFNPGADRIPDASVFHKMNIALKLEPEQCGAAPIFFCGSGSPVGNHGAFASNRRSLPIGRSNGSDKNTDNDTWSHWRCQTLDA